MKTRRFIVILSLLLCTFLSFNPSIQQLAQFPDFQTQTKLAAPAISGFWSHVIQFNEVPAVKTLAGPTAQTVQLTYKLFGIFPLKSSEVEVMPEMSLVPGGESIGVTLQSKGVMVVGQAPVVGADGKKQFPARDAGIETGDVLLKINQEEVQSDQEVASLVNDAGKSQEGLQITFKHQGQVLVRTVHPVYCPDDNRYRIGLYVRDAAAGVGTLTYYDPATNKYGALGHVINDADTNQKIDVSSGQVVASDIHSIEKGRRGHPGEKVGSFDLGSSFSGTIEKNTRTGIFGTLQGKLKNPYFSKPIPVGWQTEVKTGPAKIYTVLHGEKIGEYSIDIERVMLNRTDSKNMVIRVTDPRLLAETGGIVQGMSGSPIVQNGKLIGAVTHVFVNDSSRGYGVFIENMLRDSGFLREGKAA
ncbi:stage IV sporulation protein B [Acididesulfobacillus acetoxydans]|uniref:Stage IV sporulation protein B n=1 Tax=Acididesulfobacillus acetoxydans TaxID=1561005 RepID=A0A8S0XC70_9FIRM|nr:SpoIVB peptidase [Acididesulfobacillus acetoxydans]CAA7602106.1 stage IV sporulation protein B [Acididesulfobacillus acetoxydans]CEJ08051.1 spore_IV_B: stage IV sporulation protein B [Acididesulfobacillus acetoxydans]